MTLPKSIAAYLGTIKGQSGSQEVNKDSDGNIIDKDKIICPRCARMITGRHGNCNNCGENAQQCHYCRHINYEKPDAFLCTECGMCRYSKFEISVTVKAGYACEKIDSEESRTQAAQAIEQHLQQAQRSY
jgi:E3 ubiquitin-protein ligase UBR4